MDLACILVLAYLKISLVQMSSIQRHLSGLLGWLTAKIRHYDAQRQRLFQLTGHYASRRHIYSHFLV